MLVYARMGRRRDALNQYQLLYKALQEELGASPLPETIELYRAIQTGEITVDLMAPDQLSSRKPALETFNAPSSTHMHTHAHAISDEHEHTGHGAVVPKVEDGGGSGTLATSNQLDPERVLKVELVGRTEELQRLRQAYMAVQAGQRRVFFISGEAGIGKTRLAQELSMLAEQQRASV